MLILKANADLKKVFTRLIGTVKAPVTWTNMFVVANNNLILLGNIRSLIFSFDSRKVYTNIMDIPTENKRIEAIPNKALINNIFNVTLYVFGKWGSIGGLKVEKDYAALNELFENVFRPIRVETEFRAENMRFYQDGFQITFEEAIQKAMNLLKEEGKAGPEEDGEEQAEPEEREEQEDSEDGPEEEYGEDEYEIGLWHKMVWKTEACEFGKSARSEQDTVKSRIGNNFYMTEYQCPKCGEKLYMAVYPVDRELLIETQEARVYMARVYACNACNAFYTPRPGKLLQEGDVYSLKFDRDRTAYEDYLDILGRKAERTTNYKFNEYESDRLNGKTSEMPKEEEENGNAASSGKTIPAEEMPGKSKDMDGRTAGGRREFFWKGKAENIPDKRKENEAAGKNRGNEEEERAGKGEESERNGESGNRQRAGKKLGWFAGRKENREEVRDPEAEERYQEDSVDIGLPSGRMEGAENENNGFRENKNPQNDGSALDDTDFGGRNEGRPDSGGRHLDSRLQAKLSEKTTEELKAVLAGLEHKSGGLVVEAGEKGDLSDGEYREAVKEAIRRKLTAKYDSRVETLNNLSPKQLSDLRRQIRGEDTLSAEEKEKYVKRIDSRLYKIEEKAMEQKIELSKNKNYAEIQRMIEETEKGDVSEELKEETLRKLKRIKADRAEREVEHLINHIPLHLDRKQLAVYLDRVEQYKEVDLTPYRKRLEQRKDMAEKEEIAAMVNRGGRKDRSKLWELYGELQSQEYKEENKAPFLEKIYDKIRKMDEAEIKKICPGIAGLSFEEGQKVYEKISQGMFLPELKTNTLEMIERRLTKLKTDESVQLMRKLKGDMEEQMPGFERFYFYDAREEQRRARQEEGNEEDGEEKAHRAMMRAIDGYGAAREKYEYPLVVCDTSRSGNGKEGFVLTPDHIFYHTFLNSGVADISEIEAVEANKGIIGKGIYMKSYDGKKEKLPNSVKQADWEVFAEILDDFVMYLQEKPESRSLAYMAKEKHDVKCCYRCGFVYKEGNICPKCGSKMNQ